MVFIYCINYCITLILIHKREPEPSVAESTDVLGEQAARNSDKQSNLKQFMTLVQSTQQNSTYIM